MDEKKLEFCPYIFGTLYAVFVCKKRIVANILFEVLFPILTFVPLMDLWELVFDALQKIF